MHNGIVHFLLEQKRVKVCDKSAAGIRHFCDLPTTENDVMSEKRLNFEVEMQYKAGNKCDNPISGPERKDGAAPFFLVPKRVVSFCNRRVLHFHVNIKSFFRL